MDMHNQTSHNVEWRFEVKGINMPCTSPSPSVSPPSCSPSPSLPSSPSSSPLLHLPSISPLPLSFSLSSLPLPLSLCLSPSASLPLLSLSPLSLSSLPLHLQLFSSKSLLAETSHNKIGKTVPAGVTTRYKYFLITSI